MLGSPAFNVLFMNLFTRKQVVADNHTIRIKSCFVARAGRNCDVGRSHCGLLLLAACPQGHTITV
jgi:hypothetical protein